MLNLSSYLCFPYLCTDSGLTVSWVIPIFGHNKETYIRNKEIYIWTSYFVICLTLYKNLLMIYFEQKLSSISNTHQLINKPCLDCAFLLNLSATIDHYRLKHRNVTWGGVKSCCTSHLASRQKSSVEMTECLTYKADVDIYLIIILSCFFTSDTTLNI